MNTRFDMEATSVAAYKAAINLDAALGNSFLSPIQRELIKIRASQINGCAFCLDMHSKDALNCGETSQRLFLLNAWREAKKLFHRRRAGDSNDY